MRNIHVKPSHSRSSTRDTCWKVRHIDMSCWFARMVRMHPLWWRMVRSGKHCVTWQRSTCRFQGKQHQKEGLNKQEKLRLTTINHPWNLLRAINGVNRVLNLIIAVNPINRLLNLIELNLNKGSIKRPFQKPRQASRPDLWEAGLAKIGAQIRRSNGQEARTTSF